MSAHATGWAWQQHVGHCKVLLLALADLADDRGVTRTPIELLAEMIDRDRATVIRQLARLEADGLIERHTSRAASGHQLTSTTRLVIRGKKREQAPVQQALRQPSHGATRRCLPSNPPTSGSSHHATLHGTSTGALTPAPSQNATQQGRTSTNTGARNATHKIINHSSLLSYSNNNNNRDERDAILQLMEIVVDADLGSIFEEWARYTNAHPASLVRQLRHWAGWIEEGQSEQLTHAAAQIIEAGSYTHPFAALKFKLRDTKNAATSTQDRPSHQWDKARLPEGSRWTSPSGAVLTVEYVADGYAFWQERAASETPISQVLRWRSA